MEQDESPDTGYDPIEYDIVEHTHGSGKWAYTHTHAWGSVRHSHIARAVCLKPECQAFSTHNMHPAHLD